MSFMSPATVLFPGSNILLSTFFNRAALDATREKGEGSEVLCACRGEGGRRESTRAEKQVVTTPQISHNGAQCLGGRAAHHRDYSLVDYTRNQGPYLFTSHLTSCFPRSRSQPSRRVRDLRRRADWSGCGHLLNIHPVVNKQQERLTRLSLSPGHVRARIDQE
jgi:hypothetical protein